MADVEMIESGPDKIVIDEPVKKRSRLLKFSEVQKSTTAGECETGYQNCESIAQQANQDNSYPKE